MTFCACGYKMRTSVRRGKRHALVCRRGDGGRETGPEAGGGGGGEARACTGTEMERIHMNALLTDAIMRRLSLDHEEREKGRRGQAGGGGGQRKKREVEITASHTPTPPPSPAVVQRRSGVSRALLRSASLFPGFFEKFRSSCPLGN